MVWRPRLSGKQQYHHIYAWGNDRHPVFKQDSHYEKYLAFFRTYSDYYKIDVIAYALMEWHVHLFIFDWFDHVSAFMKNLHGAYARYYNRNAQRVGHVFGERFNNKIVQVNKYGLWLSRYIHRQALEAGIVNDPKNYPWTSYRAYIGLSPRGFLRPEVILHQFGDDKNCYSYYKEFVMSEEDGPIDWRKTSNLVVGDERFKRELELKDEINREEITVSEQDLIPMISSQLKVSPELLLNPRGRDEQRLRHKAFTILVGKYGLSLRKVAQIFNVSTMAVAKVLKNERRKV